MDENELIKEIELHEDEARRLKAKLLELVHSNRKPPKVLGQEIAADWAVYNGDSVEVIKGIPSNSIHYNIFSPPFSSLFTYSASNRDMGNSTDKQFYHHFEYLIPEILRVTIPGRLMTIHCSDIPAMKERDGYMGLKDFPGYLREICERYGWILHSKHVIWKDPLIEATRTKALGLAHKQVVKDSSRCRAGLPDWLYTFMKPGDNPYPISRGRGFEEYIGDKSEPKAPKNDDPSKNKYSHLVWQRYASPVWMDINQGETLNVRLAREKNDERHICPLQLPVIARCIELWTNKGDTVASWFAGIGSEGYQAIKMGRKAILVELKTSYYNILVKNMKNCSKGKGGFKI